MSGKLTYKDALKSLKGEIKAYRRGWEDGVYIYKQDASTIDDIEKCKNPVLKSLFEKTGNPINIESHIDLLSEEDNTIIIGWKPTLEDKKASDWELVIPE